MTLSLDSPHFVSDFQSKCFELKVQNTGALYGRETVSSPDYRSRDLSAVETTIIKASAWSRRRCLSTGYRLLPWTGS